MQQRFANFKSAERRRRPDAFLQRAEISGVVGLKKMYRGLGVDVVQLIRLGSFALLAAMLAAWISGEALAKAAVRLHHAERSLADTHATLPANSGQPSPMHYFGGPKSPMWHGPK
jgi:hypothetical protein